MYDAGGRRAPSTDVRMALAVRQVAGLVARYYIVLFTAVGRRCSLQASRELLSSGALTAVSDMRSKLPVSSAYKGSRSVRLLCISRYVS